jgi:capsular exopolysaccharide synthesis family protein
VSRIFKQMQKANGGADRTARESQVLDLEKLLHAINRTVEEQLSGIAAVPPEARVEAVLDAVQESPAVACDVVEFPLDRYRQVDIIGDTEKVFSPERETTPAPPALEAYRSFRTRILRLQDKHHFHTVAVSSAAQNEGKTLTTLNLALCCAQLPEFPVLVIDGDIRTRGISRLMDQGEMQGLAELLEGALCPEQVVLATNIPNLHILPAGNTFKSPPELLSGTPWKDFVGWCKENFKLVFVDCPPVLPLADFDLISAVCETVLLVVRARVTDKEALKRILAHVDSTKLLGVTLNAVARSDHRPYEYYYYARKK